MIAAILDEAGFQDNAVRKFTLHRSVPALRVAQFQRARIDSDHAPLREVGVFRGCGQRAGISGVPLERRQVPVVRGETRIESVRDGSPSIEV